MKQIANIKKIPALIWAYYYQRAQLPANEAAPLSCKANWFPPGIAELALHCSRTYLAVGLIADSGGLQQLWAPVGAPSFQATQT